MEKKKGETSLQTLINQMEPVLNQGEYVFVTVEDMTSIPTTVIISLMKEQEGYTLIMSKSNAEKLDLSFDYIASWITLNIHSSLEAVGLTAAFSSALAAENISCNVIAGYYHDHIFVDCKDQDKALQALKGMSSL